MGEEGNTHRIFVEKSEVKRPLRRFRCGWVDNNKMVLIEIGLGDIDWIDLTQDRDQWKDLVNTVIHFRVP
jgi:hypothetical protein